MIKNIEGTKKNVFNFQWEMGEESVKGSLKTKILYLCGCCFWKFRDLSSEEIPCLEM